MSLGRVVAAVVALGGLLGGTLQAGTAPPDDPWANHVAKVEDLGAVAGAPTQNATGQQKELALPVGTRGSDIRAMLRAVRDDARASIPIPATFGDLAMEISDLLIPGLDWDGTGTPGFALLRTVRIPDLDERWTTVSWLVALRGNADGAVGPDQEKAGIVLLAASRPGREAPLSGVQPTADKRAVEAVRTDGEEPHRVRLSIAPGPRPDAAQRAADIALAKTAGLAFDRAVLAPETAYVKAFIRKEFQSEVEKVEPVRGRVVPFVLRALYRDLQDAAARLAADPAAGGENARAAALAQLMVRECALALTLSAGEQAERVARLQKLSSWWREREANLSFEGEKMRRIDFETRISETADPATRLRLARAYEGSFADMYAEGGDYQQLIDFLNAVARKHGYPTFVALRIEQVFGVDAAAFQTWVREAFEATEKPAEAFVAALRAFKKESATAGGGASGGDTLGYWEVSYLKRAWLKHRLGVDELPKLSAEQARGVLERYLADVGFDLGAAPYDRITMDSYQDPLKLDASGVAATATPTDAYFTSNLKPGEPVPLEEFETIVHETLHTLHYQTSGSAPAGSSAYQNLMYPYIAEGITMSGQDLPWATPKLMKRYFGDLPGFTPKLLETYPEVHRQATAWDLRRLLVMALMEMELYRDRDAANEPRSWKERLAAWPVLLKKRLWVVPDGIELGQILCRMHPTAEQHQLMYASYSLGRILVGRLRDAIVHEGTPAELARYGEIVRQIMRRGALANQPFVQGLGASL